MSWGWVEEKLEEGGGAGGCCSMEGELGSAVFRIDLGHVSILVE